MANYSSSSSSNMQPNAGSPLPSGHEAVDLITSVQQPPYGVVPDPINPIVVNPAPAPAGITDPIIPPIDDGENEALGFVSGRDWDARVPSVVGGQRNLEVRFSKTGKLNTATKYETGNPFCSMDVSAFQRHEDEALAGFAPMEFRDSRIVLGVTKGVHRTARDCTVRYRRYEGKIEVIRSIWRCTKIMMTPEPGYAAVFLSGLDADNLAARRALTQIFNDSSQVIADLAGTAVYLRELFEKPVEVTRFTMRLAMMYVESRMLVGESPDTVTFDSMSRPDIAGANSWTAYRREIAGDKVNTGISNYVPWMQMTATKLPLEEKILEVLMCATLPDVCMRTGRRLVTPIVWPAIHNMRFITNFTPLPRHDQAEWTFYPSEIYAAARIWSVRYGDVDLLEQLIQFCMLVYWGDDRRGGTNVVSGMTDLVLPLPEAAMRGFLTAPYLAARDVSRDVLREVGEEDWPKKLAETLSTVDLTSFAHSWVSWQFCDYVMMFEKLTTPEIERRLGLVRIQCDYCPRWGMVQELLNSMGYKGKIGDWLSRLGSAIPANEYNLELASERRVMSGDMIPFLPILPDGCGAHGWIQPTILPPRVGIANQATTFASLPVGEVRRMVASLDELLYMDFFYTVQSRRTLSLVQTAAKRGRRCFSGTAPDLPFMAVTRRGGDRIRWGFTLPQGSIGAATFADHDRYHLQWFVMSSRQSVTPAISLVENPLPGTMAGGERGGRPPGDDGSEMRQRVAELHPREPDTTRDPRKRVREVEKENEKYLAAMEDKLREAERAHEAEVLRQQSLPPPPPPPPVTRPMIIPSQLGDMEEELRIMARERWHGIETALEVAGLDVAKEKQRESSDEDTGSGGLKGGQTAAEAAHMGCPDVHGACRGPIDGVRKRRDGGDDDDQASGTVAGTKPPRVPVKEAQPTASGAAKDRCSHAVTGTINDCAKCPLTDEEYAGFKHAALDTLVRGKDELRDSARELLLTKRVKFAHERVLMRVIDRALVADKTIGPSDWENNFTTNGAKHGLDIAKRKEELKLEAERVQRLHSWGKPWFTTEEVAYLQELKETLRLDLGRTVASVEEGIWRRRQTFLSPGALMGFDRRCRDYLCVEAMCYKAEMMEPMVQQKLAATFLKGVSVETSGGYPCRACSCIGGFYDHEDETGRTLPRDAIERRIRYMLERNGHARTEEECQRMLLVGGCPLEMVRRYGGKWRGRKNELTRQRAQRWALARMECSQWEVTTYRVERWYQSLHPADRARYLAECHPGAIGPEHFKRLGVQVRLNDDRVEEERRKKSFDEWMYDRDHSADGYVESVTGWMQKEYGTQTERKSDMIKSPLVGGIPIVYTAAIALEAMPAIGPLLEMLHNGSGVSEEAVICATAIGIMALPHRVVREIMTSGLLLVPLHEWWTAAKQHFTNVRRTLTWGDVRYSEELLAVRKILNVTIRVRGDSDIDSENFNRCCIVTRKHIWGTARATARMSAYTLYEQQFRKWARCTVQECFSSYNKDILAKSMAEFWEERAIRGASGASKRIKEMTWQDERLSAQDRPGKKALVEFLDEEALQRALAGAPVNRAYYFVKPEPGRKLRSLYATYDEESFVSAYVSQGVENYMGASKGVMVRQTPADVIEWMAVGQGTALSAEAKDAYWLSTDYSDYNSEHTFFEMQTFDMCVAQLLEEAPTSWRNEEKAAAAYWVAAAYEKSVIIYGQGQKFAEHPGMRDGGNAGKYAQVVNGLYSGTRNTARNNTWIHRVSLLIAQNEMPKYVHGADFKWSALCGDDEDVAFRNEMVAGQYYATLGAVGHQLNPVKQLAGRDNHEFLQLTAAKEVRVEKPLFSLLATLATGNWYTQLGTWLQTAPVGVVSNYWELYCRGMRKQHARRLARATLDRLMKVKIPAEIGEDGEPVGEVKDKELEWWSMRFSVEMAPLFRWQPGDEVIDLPRFEAVAENSGGWPDRASKAYVRANDQLLKHLPKRIRKEFVSSVQGQTIGAVLKGWQQKSAKRWCAKHWPERTNDSRIEVEKRAEWDKIGRDDVEIDEVRYGYSGKKEMITEEAVCGKMGVPHFVARRLGGVEKLAGKVSLAQWSRACNTNPKFVPINGNGHKLQMNLRAAMTWAKVPTKRWHGSKQHRTPKKLRYMYIGNGGGKTHMRRNVKGANDLDEVWMDEFGSVREAHDARAARSSFGRVNKVMQQLCEQSLKTEGVLLGQVDPGEITQACQMAGLECEVAYYDPGEEVRAERMRARGWKEDKVQRRIRRCADVYSRCKTENAYVKLGSYSAAEDWVRRGRTAYERELLDTTGTDVRITAKFVFDRTEAVTRKIEIEGKA